jgi:tyrosyl-tRNA synthetase
MQPDEALGLLKQGSAQIINESELREKLALGRPLRVKLGVDPTTSDIHLGHTIVLRKLRQFQDLGTRQFYHRRFYRNDGDPSGRSVTRPHLTHQEVITNAATYREQAFKILDPERTETVCNGDWFRAMSFEDVIRLNSRVTLQQLLQREDFKARIEEKHPIRAHEVQYPIMQGWDSVMVKADVELGGTTNFSTFSSGAIFNEKRSMPQQVCSCSRFSKAWMAPKK